MTLYVYPFVFAWKNIIPTDYPFIHINGPEGTKGCLLAFDDFEKYKKFCGDDYFTPIEMGVNDGKKQN